MIDLTGKPIAITGASSGIGRATALACARAGMPVALGARRVDRLEEVVREITAAGGRAVAVATDVTAPGDCRRLIDRAAELGPLYAVFANAGYGFEKPVGRTTDDEVRAIFETNFYGTLNTVRPALERMLPAGAGHVLICSSCLSKFGMPFLAPYSATKAAQDHFARAMRTELAGSGVRVSSVHPIGTRTEFFERSDARSGHVEGALRTPRFFMQPPERVANAIVRHMRSPGPAGGEVWTSLTVRLVFALATAFPGAADWGLRRKVEREKRSQG